MRVEHTLKQLQVSLVLLVALNKLLCLVNSALQHFNVGEDELKVNCLNVALGVNASVYVYNIVVLKTAHNVNNRVALADIREELVPQTFALGRALYKSRYVNELNRRGCVFVGVVHLGELVESLVGHGYNAHIRLNRAERVVCRLRPRVCNRVEQRTLSDIR